MEKSRQVKILSIIALVVAIAGMTLGFAAFSKVLTITSSAKVIPNEDDFNIVASGSRTDATVNTITPVLTGGVMAEPSEIVNEGNQIIIDSTVKFTAPGQSAEYTLYMHNIGEYDAYLKSIKFGNVGNSELRKVCTPDVEGEIDSTKLAEVCEYINLTLALQMGSAQYIPIEEDISFTDEVILDKKEIASGKVIITYPEDAPRLDSPFSIQFGSIEFTYSTT